MKLFANQKTITDVTLSMESRITKLEDICKRFEYLASETADFHNALYDYLGVEARKSSGVIFVKKEAKKE